MISKSIFQVVQTRRYSCAALIYLEVQNFSLKYKQAAYCSFPLKIIRIIDGDKVNNLVLFIFFKSWKKCSFLSWVATSNSDLRRFCVSQGILTSWSALWLVSCWFYRFGTRGSIGRDISGIPSWQKSCRVGSRLGWDEKISLIPIFCQDRWAQSQLAKFQVKFGRVEENHDTPWLLARSWGRSSPTWLTMTLGSKVEESEDFTRFSQVFYAEKGWGQLRKIPILPNF